MKIAIGSDHGGYDLKEQLKYYLTKNGYEVIDVGTYSKDSCHYPEFAIKCARQVCVNLVSLFAQLVKVLQWPLTKSKAYVLA